MSDKTLQEQIAEERAALAGLDVGADGDGGATPDQGDDLLDIQSPAEEPTSAAKKKSIPTIVKVLGGGAVLGLGLLVALQMATPKPQATTQGFQWVSCQEGMRAVTRAVSASIFQTDTSSKTALH